MPQKGKSRYDTEREIEICRGRGKVGGDKRAHGNRPHRTHNKISVEKVKYTK